MVRIIVPTIVSLLLLAASLVCASESEQDSVRSLRREIYSYRQGLHNLKRKISLIEGNLGRKNEQYINVIKLKAEVEKEIEGQKIKINDQKNKFAQIDSSLRKRLASLVIEEIDEEEDAQELIQKATNKSIILKDLDTLNKLSGKLQSISLHLFSLASQYQSYKDNEAAFKTILFELEENKKKTVQEYFEVEKKQALLDGQILRKKGNGHKNESVTNQATFSLPIIDFISVEKFKKGLNLKYRGELPIYGPDSGKVVYNGPLSNIGQVIILDHGQETRTVILGNFISKVKADDEINKGQILGYTRGLDANSKIYFEVRQKNEVKDIMKFVQLPTLEGPQLAKRR